MLAYRQVLAISASSLLFGGCACQPWTGPKTVLAPTGQTLCAKHRVPLVTARAYRAREDACILMTPEWSRAAACFPNHISARTSLRSGGKVFITPTTIRYCPICERELDREADRVQ